MTLSLGVDNVVLYIAQFQVMGNNHERYDECGQRLCNI